MTNSVPLLPLNSGTSIPQLGFGVFQVDPAETQRVVEDGLEVGYRHVDTATGYNNETEVGAGIVASGIPREEIFVTTKLRNDHHKAGDVTGGFERSLDMLGVDYIDLYLIHWPMPANDRFVETWRAFEGFLADGRAKAIGVSNFLIPHLERLIAETGTVPAANQIEVHPYYQQSELREFGGQHGIVTEAWSPLAQGELVDEPSVNAIADAHGKTLAQVILRWHIQEGSVVIPKSNRKERLQENFDIFDFELTAEEQATITALERGGRMGPWPMDVN